MYIKMIVVVVVCAIMSQGISAGYPGFFGYQQPSQGFFPPAPVFYQPRPTLRYDVGLAPPAPPQHYYSPPENTYRGFSYETRYQDGASSHVVYVTGPQSQEIMQRSFAQFRNVLPVATSRPVLPTLPAIVSPVTNSTPTPTVDRSGPIVTSLPRQFTPVFNVPQFIPPPFPYRSFASPFFNVVPPQIRGHYLTSAPSQSNAEPASEVQESRIQEVAVPEIISNRIGDNQDAGAVSSTPAALVEASSLPTTSTQASVDATTSEEPTVVTEAQTESSSAAPAADDTPAAEDTPAAPETATSAEETPAAEVTTPVPSDQEDSSPAAENSQQSEVVTEEQKPDAQTEAASEENTTVA